MSECLFRRLVCGTSCTCSQKNIFVFIFCGLSRVKLWNLMVLCYSRHCLSWFDYPFLTVCTTVEQVTIARVYNWDVHQRRMRQAATAKDSWNQNHPPRFRGGRIIFRAAVWSWSLFIAWLGWWDCLSSHLHFEFQMCFIRSISVLGLLLGPDLMYNATKGLEQWFLYCR